MKSFLYVNPSRGRIKTSEGLMTRFSNRNPSWDCLKTLAWKSLSIHGACTLVSELIYHTGFCARVKARKPVTVSELNAI